MNEEELIKECLEISKMENETIKRKMFENIIKNAKFIQLMEDHSMINKLFNEIK